MQDVDTVICGDNREVMAQMPDGVFQTCITSPPYWSLRDYGLEPTVWDGDPECEHEWGDVLPSPSDNHWHNMSKYNQEKGLQGRGGKAGQFCQLCGAWRGALGLEPSPELYVAHIVDIFREVRRTLRKDGTVWLNIGDSYWGGKGKSGYELPHEAEKRLAHGETLQHGHQVPGYMDMRPSDGRHPTLKPKDLCLIPERLAIALQQDGWWIRVRIPWIKLNGMPSSQGDRPTVSHEYIFLMSKAQRYYYDQEGVRVPHARDWGNGKAGGSLVNAPRYRENSLTMGAGWEHRGSGPPRMNPSGRYRRTTDWWYDSLSQLFSDEFMAFALPTEPFTMEMCKTCKQVYTKSEYNKLGVLIIPAEQSETGKEQKKRICAGCGSTDDWLSHFATFGEKLVTPMILAGTSSLACEKCGAPWVRVVEKSPVPHDGKTETRTVTGMNANRLALMRQAARERGGEYTNNSKTVGWKPSCSCENNDGSGRAIVLDPFAGSGTTCTVAKKLGRAYIGIEQNPDYVLLSDRRLEETEVETEEESRQLDMFAQAAGD